jgi:hypothetical protein
VSVLRNLIPSCRPDNLKQSQGREARSLYQRLLQWWASVRP